MKINILFFGSLIDATGGRSEIQLEGYSSMDSLKDALAEKYPELNNYSFRVALNQQITEGNSALNDNDVVALLPPFAGG